MPPSRRDTAQFLEAHMGKPTAYVIISVSNASDVIETTLGELSKDSCNQQHEGNAVESSGSLKMVETSSRNVEKLNSLMGVSSAL